MFYFCALVCTVFVLRFTRVFVCVCVLHVCPAWSCLCPVSVCAPQARTAADGGAH